MRSILIILLFFSTNLLQAQDTIEFEKLFVGNGGKQLSTHFNKTVDIDIPQSKDTYNQKQASIIINKFFSKNTPISYKAKHNGGGNNRSYYEIGKLSTKEKTFRTYLLYNKVDEKLQIIELRVEIEE